MQPPAINALSEHVIDYTMQRGCLSAYHADTEHEDKRNVPLNRHRSSHVLSFPNRVTPEKFVKPISVLEGISTQCQTTVSLELERLKSSGCCNTKVGDTAGTQVKVSKREYNRCRQQKYRSNQLNLIITLEDKIRRLGGNIDILKQRRYQLTFQVPRQLTVSIVATQYFRIFQRGIRGSISLNDFEFLQVALAPDVLFDSLRSLDAHLKHWTLLTQYFTDIHTELKQMKQMTDCVLVADITTTFTISETLMSHVFPHLFMSGKNTRCAHVAAKLQGQRLVLDGYVRFEWDVDLKRVTNVQSILDMMPAVLEVLIEPEDVVLMFSKALIGPGFDL